MALLHISVYSQSLKGNTQLNVISHGRLKDGRDPPVLVLLHGWAGNHHDWLLGSDIARLSEERGLTVVLPSGGNHFYLDDDETEELHSHWLVNELPAVLKDHLGIAWDRQRCYLGGYSMGGYGALRNGLAFPDRFGGLIALSSALITQEISSLRPGDRTPYAGYGYYRQVFGDLSRLLGSDRDVEALVVRAAAGPLPLPRLYLACGTEDFLLEPNRSLRRCLEKHHIPHFAVEASGGHDFTFWNAQIAEALGWMFQEEARWT